MTEGHGAQQVSMNIEDLVRIMAREIAREVVDELRRSDISPMAQRLESAEAEIEQLKLNQNTQQTREKTALDIIWKVAVLLAGSISVLVKLFPNIFSHL
jgi:hypothetical protein